MKKVFFILLTVLFLAACSNGTDQEEINDAQIKEESAIESKKEDTLETTGINTTEVETLPFDKDEFIERYFKNADDYDEAKNSMKLSVEEGSITLAFGTMIEAQILLNTLNEFMQINSIDELTEDMVTTLVDSGTYEENLITNGLDIWISAIDSSSVMVTVLSE